MEWLDILKAGGVPCAPVNTLETALREPALLHRGMVVSMDHEGDIGGVKALYPDVDHSVHMELGVGQLHRLHLLSVTLGAELPGGKEYLAAFFAPGRGQIGAACWDAIRDSGIDPNAIESAYVANAIGGVITGQTMVAGGGVRRWPCRYQRSARACPCIWPPFPRRTEPRRRRRPRWRSI